MDRKSYVLASIYEARTTLPWQPAHCASTYDTERQDRIRRAFDADLMARLALRTAS